MNRTAIIAVCLAALGGSWPTQADGPVGIAYVEAPEQAAGICTAGNPDAAFACAKRKCTAGGARAGDCLRRAWCYPSGWSVDLFVQHGEGPHWHEFSCGLDSRETAVKVAAARCDRLARPYLIECTAVRLYDPDGKPVALE